MRAARLATLLFVLLAVLAVSSQAKSPAPASGPKSLRGFLLRPSEPVRHSFPRTPAFAWNPVPGAACYEFQLATSRTFEDSTLVWSNVPTTARAGRFCGPVKFTSFTAQVGEDEETATKTTTLSAIRIPAVSLDLTLPWFSGRPYALYAHVRAITARGPTKWSRSFGFDMRWEEFPVPMVGRPGLVRWNPVEGATGYQIWFPGNLPGFPTGKLVSSNTNVADLREFYSSISTTPGGPRSAGACAPCDRSRGRSPNGLPAVSYGPWSPEYAATNPAWSSGKIQLRAALSDVVTAAGDSGSHQLMPGFSFSGDQGLDGNQYRLFRLYAATDRQCVNVVFKGSVVGGPAFAPRTSGPLKLPVSGLDIDWAQYGLLPSWVDENAETRTVETTIVRATETIGEDKTARVDLPDLDPRTTRYYWTVVPVAMASGSFESETLVYYDIESPQDACEAGRVARFGKVARPAITSSGTPYVSGLTPKGRLLASASNRPVVYSTPLVAWRPVVGATSYEIQWSRTTYPWRPRGKVTTFATSAVLKLPAGTWYYRVRGLNSVQLGISAMTWSQPVAVRVARPTFRVSG